MQGTATSAMARSLTRLPLLEQEKIRELQAQLQAEQGENAEVVSQTNMLAQALKVRLAGTA